MSITKQKIQRIIDEVHLLYGGKTIELTHSSHFQLLVAIVLSAQTTDIQVNKVTSELFRIFPDAASLAQADFQTVIKTLSSINFFQNKARYCIELSKILLEKYEGIPPDTLPKLLELPGVGIKTAKVYLSHVYNLPLIGVDTHIHRVANRLGIVSTQTPMETDKSLESLLSDSQKKTLHHPLVLFGRYQCRALRPRCSECRLQDICNFYKKKGAFSPFQKSKNV